MMQSIEKSKHKNEQLKTLENPTYQDHPPSNSSRLPNPDIDSNKSRALPVKHRNNPACNSIERRIHLEPNDP